MYVVKQELFSSTLNILQYSVAWKSRLNEGDVASLMEEQDEGDDSGMITKEESVGERYN